MVRRLAFALTSLPLALATSPAVAAPRASIAPSPARQALAIARDDTRGGVVARACAGRCEAAGGTLFPFPDDVDGANATIEVVALGPGREVGLVSAPIQDGDGRWVLVLAPPKRGEPSVVVKTLRGHLDRASGALEGERETNVLRRVKDDGRERLILGTRYENATLCGRDALLRVRELDPETLRWVPRAADSLDAAAKRGATALDATRGEPFVADQPRLLAGRVASSAKGRSALHATDRDLATRWAEARPKDGAGEFLVTSSTPAVSITGIEVVVRGGDQPGAAAPARFFVVTPDEVFAVRLPEDAMTQPAGTTYGANLPTPVATRCLGVVLDQGHVDEERADVGFAEIRARTAFDGKTPDELVSALEGPEAGGAQALLSRGGTPSVKATIAAYDRLGPEGREHALEVIDSGACPQTSPFFAEMLLGKHSPDARFDPALDRDARHARDRLQACPGTAVKALVAAMKAAGVAKERVWAARELVDVDPVASIEPILAVLTEGSEAPEAPGTHDDVRRGLRGALAMALRHRRAPEALGRLLGDGFEARPLVTRIDVLRAAGPALEGQPAAEAALLALLKDAPTFRTKYLLAPPAAVLAAAGSPAATELLRSALGDASPHLRGRAIELVGTIPALAPEAKKALGDRHPRVRRAALEALIAAPTPDPSVEGTVVRMLQDDPWTFVQTRAARVLASLPRSAASDAALVAAVEGTRRPVVVSALEAMGARGQHEAGALIDDMADNPKLAVPVRTAAIHALGALCRQASADLLTKLALRSAFQQLPYDQPLGLASLSALGRIKPPDLDKRLAPLLAMNARIPRTVRQLARDAIRKPSSCLPES